MASPVKLFFCCILVTWAAAVPVMEEVKDNRPEVRALHINSDIKYRYAETVIRSLVVNPSSTAQEYIFHVVLPQEAFITGFVMTINEKDYPAHVGEKEKAKKEYDEAESAGLGAAHVAYNARNSNDFKINLNIEPAGKVWFNLTYEDFLARTLGSYEHKINVNPGQIVEDMIIAVTIEDKSPLIKLKVPELRMTNEISQDVEKDNELAKIEKISDEKMKVTWAPSPDEQRALKEDGVSGQFIVKYDVDRSKNAQQVLINDGYFVHFFSDDNLPSLNKHVVFVLDLSGSMAGTKMEQLKTAMNKILNDLKPTDYFSIVLFSNTAEAWPLNGTVPKLYGYFSRENEKQQESELTPSHVIEANTDNIEIAKMFIDKLDHMGGTNIIAGLRNGISLAKMGTHLLENDVPSSQPKPIIVFLTDGEPNVEESNPVKITEITTRLNSGLSPIYSLGFGVGADMKFLRNLSLANNAFARHIYEASDAALQLEQFFKMISSPLLSDVHFEYVPQEVADVTKSNFFSMNAGEELVVVGRMKEQKSCATGYMRMTGIEGKRELILPQCVIIDEPPISPTEIPTNKTFGPLEKLWAYKTIKQLLDNHTLTQNEEAKKHALELALKYSFVTPLTSLVVVKPNETTSVNAEDSERQMAIGVSASSYAAMPAFDFRKPVRFTARQMISTGHLQVSNRIPQGRPGQLQSAPDFGSFVGYSALSIGGPLPGPHVNKYFDFMAPTTTPSNYQLSTTAMPTKKVDITDIQWLDQNPVEINGSYYLKPLPSPEAANLITDLIALNMTTEEPEVCTINHSAESGHCVHFIECPLRSFSDESMIQVYRNSFQCSISDDTSTTMYLGVCCPDSITGLATTLPTIETTTETS